MLVLCMGCDLWISSELSRISLQLMNLTPSQEAELKRRARAMMGWTALSRWCSVLLNRDVPVSELKADYALMIENERNDVRFQLAQTQIDKALAGDNTMLIWLGKQHLAQTDKAATEVSGKTDIRIVLAPTHEEPKHIQDAEIIAIGPKDASL